MAENDAAAAARGAAAEPEETSVIPADTGATAEPPGVPAASPASSVATGAGDAPEPLLGTAGPQLHSRWQQVLASFVDDPRGAVREADALLEETTALLTSRLDERRKTLHDAWQDEAGSSTEDLRLALRSYRSVIQHLLEA
jgi:hypothetical protein